jgi:hypothetical protein
MVHSALGFPLIVSRTFVGNLIRVTNCANEACTSSTSNTVGTGQNPSIALGADGNPVVVFSDAASNDLRFVRCLDPDCATTAPSVNIDSTNTATPSIVIGADGFPTIAYQRFSAVQAGLHVAKCSSASCFGGAGTSNQLIADPGATGIAPSIAIDVLGLPVIAYGRTSATGPLAFVKCLDPQCTSTTNPTQIVDSGGGFSSVTLSADAKPLISTVRTNGDIVVVRCASFTCPVLGFTSGTVKLNDGAQVPTWMTIGTDGDPVIVFLDNSGASGLWVSKCVEEECSGSPGETTESQIDGADLAGAPYAAMIIGPSGFPIIAYRGATDLTVVKCTNRFCVPNVVTR